MTSSVDDDISANSPAKPRADQNTLRGAFWLVSATFIGMGTWTQVKILGEGLPSIEIAFFRAMFGLIIIIPFMLRVGRPAFQTKHPRLQMLRGLNSSLILSLGYYAITHLPIALVTSISFSRPLFLLLLAALVLKETIHRHRTIATAVGFIGVLVILRPGVETDPVAFVALANAGLMAFGVVLMRLTARDDRTETMIFFSTAIQTVLLLGPALYYWVTPTQTQMMMLFGIGITGTLMQSCMVRAYRYAEASALAPFDYTRLIFASVVGYLVFGEVVDIYTWAGAGILISATLYIARREAKLRAQSGVLDTP